MRIAVAIDGPAGAGKSTIAKIVDKKFVSVIVKEKKNLWDALKLMLSKELKEDE